MAEQWFMTESTDDASCVIDSMPVDHHFCAQINVLTQLYNELTFMHLFMYSNSLIIHDSKAFRHHYRAIMGEIQLP